MLGTQIVEHLKRLYPNPIVADDDDQPGKYCVGGALCLAVAQLRHASEIYVAFPNDEQLTHVLCEFNPAMLHHEDRAEKAAIRIISYNDQGKFQAAWSELEKVLNWATREQTVLDQQPKEQTPVCTPAQIKPRRRHRAQSRHDYSEHRRAFQERGIRIRFWGQMRKAAQMK